MKFLSVYLRGGDGEGGVTEIALAAALWQDKRYEPSNSNDPNLPLAIPSAPANDPRPPDGATIGQGIIHMPEPHITVAPTQEYVLALVVLLMQLKKARRDIVFEMMLLLTGIAAGSVLPTIGVLLDWHQTSDLGILGFLTCMLLSGSASGALVCWRIVRKKGSDFEDTMAEIMKGQRFDSRGNSIAPQSPGRTHQGQSVG